MDLVGSDHIIDLTKICFYNVVLSIMTDLTSVYTENGFNSVRLSSMLSMNEHLGPLDISVSVGESVSSGTADQVNSAGSRECCSCCVSSQVLSLMAGCCC